MLANINMVLGMFFFGLLVASCGNALTRASQSAAQLYKHRKKVGALGTQAVLCHVNRRGVRGNREASGGASVGLGWRC